MHSAELHSHTHVYMHNVNKITNQTEECARNHFTNDIYAYFKLDRVETAHGLLPGTRKAIRMRVHRTIHRWTTYKTISCWVLCAFFLIPIFHKKKYVPEYRSIGHVCHVDLVIRGAHAQTCHSTDRI